MKLSRPSGLTLLTAALIVLLPALAVLQYRWVGQVSDAERERMQHNLRNAASQFRDAFDAEIARAVLSLQVGPVTARDGSSEQYTDRYEAWVDTSEHPRLVSDIFLVDSVGPTLRMRRFDTGQHAFVEAEWPDTLRQLRPDFERQVHDFNAGLPVDRRALLSDDETFMVMPLRNIVGPGSPDGSRPPSITPVFGYTIVQLDDRYIREEILPSLARRYFIHQDGDSYRVAVVSVSNPQRVLYKSDSNATVDPKSADASEMFFGSRGGPRFLFGRGGGNGLRFAGGGPPTRGEEPRIPANIAPRDEERGRWRLVVQHASGSLETAVSSVRRRNLAISFGVLLLLTVSVVLLTAASRRAHRLAEQQMEFVAGVTHELRTPVAVIRSAAENLSHGVVGNTERVKRYGTVIESEARRLGEMIESVLQYAGLESGASLGNTSAVAPAELIDAAIETAVAASGGDVHIQREIAADLPNVIGDAAALRSAIQNLIANAVKYGGADRWVGVRAEQVPGRRPEVCVTVSDHGAGIPPADLPHIFEPFYRGSDVVAGQIHGNGLGLSLVRRIAMAHGGRVSVTSKPNSGTTFSLTIPAAPPELRHTAVASGESVAAHT